jgi:PAS domain S-box-containing protein
MKTSDRSPLQILPDTWSAAEQQAFALFDRAGFGAALVRGAELRFALTNPAFQALAGGTDAAPLVGRAAGQVFPGATALLDALRTVLETGTGTRLGELPAPVPAAEPEAWWDVELVPLVVAEAAVAGIVLVVRDVTEPVRARQRLTVELAAAEQRAAEAAEASRMLDAVMEYAPEGITIADAPDVRIRRVSRYGRELTGRSAEVIEGIPARDAEHSTKWGLFHADGETPATDPELPLTRAVVAGEVVTGEEWVLRRPDGSRVTILCNAGPIRDEGGAVVGGIIAWRDIDDRKAAERELQQAYDAAQRALEERDGVLAIVSHDLRNPLSTIAMAASLLLADVPPEKKQAQAGIIRRSVDQMSRLIEDLLDAASIDGGGLRVLPEPCAAGDLLRATLDFHTPLADSASIALRAAATTAARVHADRQRVLQLFTNLITNAVACTPPGGEIVLAAVDDGDHVRFSVRDTGTGIEPADLPRIFDRFWQARRAGRSGAGLGLAIARGIVHAHGGRLQAESTPGAGSTFTFTLPRVAGDGTP